MPSLNIQITDSSNTATDKFSDPYFLMSVEDATNLPPVYVFTNFSITTAPELIYEEGEPEIWSITSFSVTSNSSITASPSGEFDGYDANTVIVSANGSYFDIEDQGLSIVFTSGENTPFDDKFRFLMGTGNYELFSVPNDARELGFSDLIQWLHPSYVYVTITHTFEAEITDGGSNQILKKSIEHNIYFDYIPYISLIQNLVEEGTNNAISI